VHKVWAVIRREFVERVRTKWFWVSAILGPCCSPGSSSSRSSSPWVGQFAMSRRDSTSDKMGDQVVEALETSGSSGRRSSPRTRA